MSVQKDIELLKGSQIRTEDAVTRILEHIQDIKVGLLKHEDRIDSLEHWKIGICAVGGFLSGLFVWLAEDIKKKIGI